MTLASFLISILAFLAAAGSTIYAHRIWRIERKRDWAARRPRISAVYEEFGGSYPSLEVTNDGDEDLVYLALELLEPVVPYVSPITSLMDEDGNQIGRVDLGGLSAAQTKRLKVVPNESTRSGEVVLYADCTAADGETWRVTIKATVPEDYDPADALY